MNQSTTIMGNNSAPTELPISDNLILLVYRSYGAVIHKGNNPNRKRSKKPLFKPHWGDLLTDVRQRHLSANRFLPTKNAGLAP